MAVVLSELSRNQDSAYRGLVVEEPEAHLHPQLQAVLLRYLESIEGVRKGASIAASGSESAETLLSDTSGSAEVLSCSFETTSELPVQVFVTSHSPNFASIADLSSLICLVETDKGVASFLPRTVVFGKGKREKLQRYLDITRAELFFARRIIFVEGAAELMLVSVLAQKCGYDLRDHAVSLISVEGLNFDCFMPLFGKDKIEIPVAVITDADPTEETGGMPKPVYPAPGDIITPSANTRSMLALEDELMKVFHGLKTLEYDLALFEPNRTLMIKTLQSLHPKIGADVQTAVNAATNDRAKAKALFRGMFERESGNVSKGRFGQALAQEITASTERFTAPSYIAKAIKHVCEGAAN